ncbi:hypothetical protein GCM10010294_46980 [Streptomyces griseoloalbus]|uniref:hypothetical protein n=1 Tax=Streptomyces griseoloalbus TaxID=67303 RepID=UPI0018768F17|nr:hypothetical protein GCM10010294_46980 [Streptomyces griseoloalbus]
MQQAPRDRWAIPSKIGYVTAAQNAHFVAAPLLAAAAIGIAGVMAADGDKFRWPGPAMMLMTVCAVLFISCIQSSFNAATHLFNSADLDAWYGTSDKPPETVLMQVQQRDFQIWKSSSRRAVRLYNWGVVTLGMGTAAALAPHESASFEHAACRWTACAVVVIATVRVAVTTALEARRVRRRQHGRRDEQ